MFEVNYPIICAAMKEVSDYNLACAVKKAGCLPSLLMINKSEIIKYRNEIDDNFNVFVDLAIITDENLDVLLDVKPKVIEFAWGRTDNKNDILNNKKILKSFEKLKLNDTKLLLRELNPQTSTFDFFDGIILKGKESAGSIGAYPVKLSFLKQKELLPNIPIIPAGGIYLPATVKWYLDNGATAVYTGTPFSLTYESSIDIKVKEKLLKMNNKNIETTHLSIKDIDPAKRNTIILGDLQKQNNLKNGVNGFGGLIYSGHALEKINEIMSVQDLVNFMTSQLTS